MLAHGGTVAPRAVSYISLYTTPPGSQRTGRRMTHNNVHCPRTTSRYRSSHRGHQSDPWLPRYARPRGYGGAQGGVVYKLVLTWRHDAHSPSITSVSRRAAGATLSTISVAGTLTSHRMHSCASSAGLISFVRGAVVCPCRVLPSRPSPSSHIR